MLFPECYPYGPLQAPPQRNIMNMRNPGRPLQNI
ncbi:hypothetical protein APTSU1_001582700 [Apodemus speciosus]|uniref:Uncharacterized protein n=1 Tax=Apodemus speciosus TaxID=105296 RepID=A0ABQ0FMX0_APOSI